ncbi:MAG: hypothetical protein A2579_00580 [Lysobacterales bacterium RIFOXYD1_FULL_69_11]|nr:MAG: hypothetical protein A2190_00655 [Xanthomonadales bacterium RIFOXYA1_FULL_69_10]OHE86379.1 MAG: hypothetical protein A2579_00580 [Xanthomonadales bacterium RIFOXYD1_FULL_69_11]
MARGITQEQVNAAADALLAAGERPTVERVRAHLGTGSPNTVTRLLESWWQALGARLQAQERRMALPDAPEAVQALAAQLWTAALEAGRAHADAALAQDRAAATAEVREAAAERDAATAAAEVSQAEAEVARTEREQAQTRVADLQRLADLQAGQLNDAHALAERTQQALATAQADTAALRTQLDAVRQDAAATQAAHTAHLRQLEDRAHAEIDAARQQVRELRADAARAHAQPRQTEDGLRQALETARTALVAAEREAATQRGRAEALAQQVEALGDLPAVLRASLADGPKARGKRPSAPRAAKVPARGKPLAVRAARSTKKTP